MDATTLPEAAYRLHAVDCSVVQAPNGRWGLFCEATKFWFSRKTYAQRKDASFALRQDKKQRYYTSERITDLDLSI